MADPTSMFNCMISLGAGEELLPRAKLTDDIHLNDYIIEFIKGSIDNGKGMLSLIGQPSAGKTTEFRRIAGIIAKDSDLQSDIYPIYSELQSSSTASFRSESAGVWKAITSGSIDIELVGNSHYDSLKSFNSLAKKSGALPLLMIDTLDLLMFEEVQSNKPPELTKSWSLFLEEANKLGIIVIWTCRPYEWDQFNQEISPEIRNNLKEIILPRLDESKIDPFPKLSTLVTEKVTKLQSRLWRHWSLSLQSHMPIFANRWTIIKTKKLHLSDVFIKKLVKDFFNYLQSKLMKENEGEEESTEWLTIFQDINLPSETYYHTLWENIIEMLTQVYEHNYSELMEIRTSIESTSRIIALDQDNNFTSRIRIPLKTLIDNFNHDYKHIQINVFEDMLNLCESRGLLVRVGPWVEFCHQLIFEHAIVCDAKPNELVKLANFPSVFLRNLSKLGSDTEQIYFDVKDHIGALEAIGHWNGYMLSYHPEISSLNSNVSINWVKWVWHALDNNLFTLHEKFNSLKDPNHNTEKRIALIQYLSSMIKDKAIMVNGAPGTGKTYFCLDFLQYSLFKAGVNKKKWRYFTLNPNLAEHFNDIDWKNRNDKNVQQNIFLKHHEGAGIEINEQIRELIPIMNISLSKKLNDKTNSIGILSFVMFKNLLKSHFDSESVKHQNFDKPPVEDAWIDYNTVIHHPDTGQRTEDMHSIDEFIKHCSIDGKKKLMCTEFLKFHNKIKDSWFTRSHASWIARKTFAKMSESERGEHYLDILIIDEVQDIAPAVMSFLLELMRPGFNDKSIMIAGDKMQTVNRSGFSWISFCESTYRSLAASPHKDLKKRNRLMEFGMVREEELTKHLFTLKFVWRNSKRIIEFNNHLRTQFGSRYKLKMDDYDGDGLQISPSAIKKDSGSHISVIVAEEPKDWQRSLEIIRNSNIRNQSKIAVLLPYKDDKITNELEKKFKFKVYDADSVKGLEFDSVIILHPYELSFDEAQSSISRQLDDESKDIETRITKWAKAYNQNKDDASANNMKTFLRLYNNIKTRMNVLHSRPEFGLIILSRNKFDTGVSRFVVSDDYDRISFNTPDLPSTKGRHRKLTVGTKTSKEEIQKIVTEGLITDLTRKQSSRELFDEAVNFARSNRDGTEVDNERKAWDDLWASPITKDISAPLKSIAILGGLSYEKTPKILQILRSDLRDIDSKPPSENRMVQQFIYVLNQAIYVEGEGYKFSPELGYFLCTKLEEFMEYILSESMTVGSDYYKLINSLMFTIFGIDKKEIENNNEFKIENDKMSWKKKSLIEFGESISEDKFYYFKFNPSSLMQKILLHLIQRVKHAEIEILSEPEWVDENNLLWKELLKFSNKGATFDRQIVNNTNKQLDNFIAWIESSLLTAQIVGTKRKTSTGRVIGDDTAPLPYQVATILVDKIVPKLEYRGRFKKRDLVYLAAYKILEVDLDQHGLELLHEMLAGIMAESDNPEQGFDTIDIEFKDYLELLKSYSNNKRYFVLSIWKSDNVLGDTKRGSIIGDLIHQKIALKGVAMKISQNTNLINLSILMNESLETISSVKDLKHNRPLKFKDQNLNGKLVKLFSKKDFRYILAKVYSSLSAEEFSETITADITNENMIANLVMLDFLTILGKRGDSREFIDIQGGIPIFIRKEDIFTQITRELMENNRAGSGIFSSYSSLIHFAKKNKSLPLSNQAWFKWEWLLNHISKSGNLQDKWEVMMKNEESRSVIFNSLHYEQRSNPNQGIAKTGERVELRYFDMLRGISAKKKSEGTVNTLLDYMEGSLADKKDDDGYSKISYSNMRRHVLQAWYETGGRHHNYIDWEIIFDLWMKSTKDFGRIKFEDFVQNIQSELNDAVIALWDDGVESGSFTQLLEHSNNNEIYAMVKSFLQSMLEIGDESSVFKVVFEGIKIKEGRRLNNSPFGYNKTFETYKTAICETFIRELMRGISENFMAVDNYWSPNIHNLPASRQHWRFKTEMELQ
jgi:hypothetical protein